MQRAGMIRNESGKMILDTKKKLKAYRKRWRKIYDYHQKNRKMKGWDYD